MDSTDRSLLGIIGAGRLGQAMAQTGLRAGRRVVIADSRAPESLAPVVSALGGPAAPGGLAYIVLDPRTLLATGAPVIVPPAD